MKTTESKIKSMKKVIVATMSMLTAATIAFVSTIGFTMNDSKQMKETTSSNKVTMSQKGQPTTEHENKESIECARLKGLRKYKLSTTTKYFDGKPYQVADEKDVLRLSKEFAIVLEKYFKSCGASDWSNPYTEEFWPYEIEYLVTALAFQESSYRTDVINERGCGGLTVLHEEDVLKTLGDQWLVPRIWGDNVPQVNCNPDEVDIFNGTTCIEYTYYHIGYLLANRFKNAKYFIDEDGTKRSVWDEIEFTEDNQLRLIIASYFYGVNNVVDSVFGRNYDSNGKLIPLKDYIYSDYVESVLDKMIELEILYEPSYVF